MKEKKSELTLTFRRPDRKKCRVPVSELTSDMLLYETADEGHTVIVKVALRGLLAQLPQAFLTAEILGRPDATGTTAIQAAAKAGHMDQIPGGAFTAETLAAFDPRGFAAIHYAASNGWLKFVPKRLLTESALLLHPRVPNDDPVFAHMNIPQLASLGGRIADLPPEVFTPGVMSADDIGHGCGLQWAMEQGCYSCLPPSLFVPELFRALAEINFNWEILCSAIVEKKLDCHQIGAIQQHYVAFCEAIQRKTERSRRAGHMAPREMVEERAIRELANLFIHALFTSPHFVMTRERLVQHIGGTTLLHDLAATGHLDRISKDLFSPDMYDLVDAENRSIVWLAARFGHLSKLPAGIITAERLTTEDQFGVTPAVGAVLTHSDDSLEALAPHYLILGSAALKVLDRLHSRALVGDQDEKDHRRAGIEAIQTWLEALAKRYLRLQPASGAANRPILSY